MNTHGSPLTTEDMIDLGGMLMRLASRGIVCDREIKRYWQSHLGELERELREVMLKPGCRVLEIDRTKALEVVGNGSWNLVAQDQSAAQVTDVDLSRVRFIPCDRFSASKHILLDAHVAERFVARSEVLPTSWARISDEVFFTGTEYKKEMLYGLDPAAGYPSLFLKPGMIRASEGQVRVQLPLQEKNFLIAVLLID